MSRAYSSKEEDQAKKGHRCSYEQECIGQPCGKFARDQWKGRKLRTQKQVESLPLLFAVDSGRGKRWCDEHNQKKLYRREQSIELPSQWTQCVAIVAAWLTNEEKAQETHDQQVDDNDPDSALTTQAQA